jgi:hypothetical protein
MVAKFPSGAYFRCDENATALCHRPDDCHGILPGGHESAASLRRRRLRGLEDRGAGLRAGAERRQDGRADRGDDRLRAGVHGVLGARWRHDQGHADLAGVQADRSLHVFPDRRRKASGQDGGAVAGGRQGGPRVDRRELAADEDAGLGDRRIQGQDGADPADRRGGRILGYDRGRSFRDDRLREPEVPAVDQGRQAPHGGAGHQPGDRRDDDPRRKQGDHRGGLQEPGRDVADRAGLRGEGRDLRDRDPALPAWRAGQPGSSLLVPR